MITPRQSFVISFAAHAVLIIALIISALFVRRALKSSRIELELTAPVQVGPKTNEGPKEKPSELEPEPKITEREVNTFNRTQPFDPTKIPEISEETFEEYKPKGTVQRTGGSDTDGFPDYEALISEEIKRNWEVPGLGVRGSTVPKVQVAVTVARSGKIMGYRVTRASGNAAFDRSALEAVRLSNPLLPFPPEMPGAHKEFTFEFVPEE